MCAAHDEMDVIHEAEVAAHRRIEDAEKRAKEIKEEAEEESRKVLERAELVAKEKAKAIMAEIDGKKKEVEQKVQDEADRTLAHLKTRSHERMTEAVKTVVKVLLAEE